MNKNNYYIIGKDDLDEKFPSLFLWAGGPEMGQAHWFGEGLSDDEAKAIEKTEGVVRCVVTDEVPT